MVSIRTSKSKGNQFEYSVYDSLKPSYPDLALTKQLGFVAQYDLKDELNGFVIECKRHKTFSWNEMIKYFVKLQSKAPADYICFLIVKGNLQPCLVMYLTYDGCISVMEFEKYFRAPFLDRQNKKPNISITQ